MRKKWVGIALAMTFASGVYLGNTVLAGSGVAEPGSIDDPIVSKSYVDEQADAVKLKVKTELQTELKTQLDAQKVAVDEKLVTYDTKLAEVDKSLAEVKTNLIDLSKKISTQPASGFGLTVVEVRAGQQLIAFEGTEFIVRNGQLYSIVSAQGGIPDLTGGKDLGKDEVVPLNHLLLFPRSDGRGVRMPADSKAVAYIMVRGAYELRNADGTVVKASQ